jgi:hypothetical protein
MECQDLTARPDGEQPSKWRRKCRKALRKAGAQDTLCLDSRIPVRRCDGSNTYINEWLRRDVTLQVLVRVRVVVRSNPPLRGFQSVKSHSIEFTEFQLTLGNTLPAGRLNPLTSCT